MIDEFTRIAAAGTSRERPPSGGLSTDDLVAGVGGTSPERDLLLRAGALAVYRTAGRVPETGAAPPEPAPEETLPACSEKASEVVRLLLDGKRDAILHEALERLRLAGLRVPHALLPDLLNVQQRVLRSAVVAMLGERGRWLAARNPGWTWAVATGGFEESDETVWEEGALEDRLAALRSIRRRDGGQGLRWIEEVWKAEKAEARTAMVAALETDLSPDDEPFLERALDDRSVRVREAAASLLARLPGSAYAGRAVARADAVLAGYEPSAGGLIAGLRRGGSHGRLLIEPPEAIDASWKRDLPGVDKAPYGTGEKAWRISRSLAVVPLDHWENRFGAGAEELVVSTRVGDWEPALLAGWCRAGALHGEAGWAWPLWERCHGLPDDSEGRQAWSEAQELAPTLPQVSLARSLPDFLQGKSVQMSRRLASTLLAIPAVWTHGLSEVYVESLRAHLEALTWDPPSGGGEQWVHTLQHAAVALSPGILEAAAGMGDVLPRLKGEGVWFVRWVGSELAKFEETVELRRNLVKEIPL